MDEVFVKVLNMSIAASWLILAVLLLRLALKKAPKWAVVLLWGIAALRLAVPFSFESAWSLVPSAETFSTHNIQFETPAVSTGIPAVNNAVNPVLGEMFAPAPGASVNPLYVWTSVAAVVWLSGIAAMLLYAVVSYVRVRRSVAERVPYARNIFLCDHVRSPFILGLIAPKIYLPSHLDASAIQPVIAHEQAHLARRDHWWKPLGFLILTVHWFNPLCWIAYVLLCRDIEQACDEKVIRQLDLDGKKQYSAALLACSTGRRLALVAICPLAFGETDVKERVRNVLHYKKPAFWLVLAAVIACIAAAVCFLTDPVTAQPGTPNAQRPALLMDGEAYVDPYMPVSVLPYGYRSAGRLTAEQANNTGLAGAEYFMHPSQTEDFYTWQECGTPIALDTVDSEQRQWAYVRWIRVGSDAADERRLTLDDVMRLSQKGNALTWSDFERYAGQEIGSGLYIVRYGIDELFEVRVGGMPEVTPMYVYLMAGNDAQDRIDIRTEDVAAFIAAHGMEVPKVAASGTAAPGPDASGAAAPEGTASGTAATGAAAPGTAATGAAAPNADGGDPTAQEPAVQEPDFSTLSEEQTAIRRAILEHNRSADPAGLVFGASFAHLATMSGTPPAGSSTHHITYYGWAMYEAYKVTDSGLETVSGRHIPAAISFDADENGYTLTEYWEPREDSHFAEDILGKFPGPLTRSSQYYIPEQRQECYAQAIAAAKLDTDPVIAALLETVCSSPALSSNPEDYIEEHADAYRELTYYGQYTLLYCFARFERGGETGLEGQIMMRVCEEIAAVSGEGPLMVFNLPANMELTGQMWYDVFKNNALELMEQYTESELAERWPAYWLLLRMLGKL